jgi:hypothetical protein
MDRQLNMQMGRKSGTLMVSVTVRIDRRLNMQMGRKSGILMESVTERMDRQWNMQLGRNTGLLMESFTVRMDRPWNILRPVKETEWKTVMIPFSTLVAFRYFAQMGYNVGLKSETM